MATGLSFAFDAEKETPQSAARRRALAEAIMGRSMAPKTLGEGFSAIGDGIVANVNNSRAREAEQAGQAGASDAFSRLISGITGGAPGYTPSGSSGGALGAANSVGQSAPTTSSFDGSQQEFIDMLLPAAMAESERTGIDPRIIVAQAAQETGWGKSAPGNNFFGIKSHGQSGGQTLNTHEYINGERVNVADSFRTFGSPEESVRGYGDFITSNPRYGDFMAAQGLDAQLEALQASGYATDPNYSQSVGSIARGIALPQQPQRVASADPSMTLEMTPEMNAAIGAANPADFMDARPNTATAPADPSVLARNLPFRPGQQQGATIPGVTAPTAAAPRPAPMQRPQQVAQGPSLEELLMVSQNPWLNDGQRNALNAMIETELRRQDPAYQQDLQQGNIDLQRSQFELEQMMNPGPGPAPMSPQEMAAWGIPEGSGAWAIGDDGYPTQIFEPESSPTSVQEYEYYVQQAQAAGQQPVPYVEWDSARKTAGAQNITIGGEGSPGLGKLSTDYGYVLDPETGQPRIDPQTGLPTAAPVPGSPAAREIEAAAAAEEARMSSQAVSDAQSAANSLADISSVREIITNSDTPVTGTMSVPFAQFSGTPAGRVRSYVGTLQSNVALGAMQRLKEASATGATGFGALSAPELNLLINDIGALDPNTTEPDIFLETLQRIENNARFVVQDIKRNVSPERIQELGLQPLLDAFEEDSGGDQDTGGASGLNQSQANPGILNAPAVGTIQDGYRFKGGDPALESNWELAQ